ncbi:hypothetical protein RJ640_022450 [Escallonia rubra]|uniref:Uncharacterized protein n=1 Tax=Escallonia rubra TaxID=112253 RepID=A0AA88QL65_9ASTE|nr:hypothetical protein RJ640_022450 [Escallonia rubra]
MAPVRGRLGGGTRNLDGVAGLGWGGVAAAFWEEAKEQWREVGYRRLWRRQRRVQGRREGVLLVGFKKGLRRFENGIFMSQEGYAKEMLNKFKMLDCNSIKQLRINWQEANDYANYSNNPNQLLLRWKNR